ncbi:hypothetical protein DM02DRAFT_731664 [Periconia macrospinosa]|uniref:Uncharacterized protein n=1 Tax=Periconia macrospinosa TaxID=97972 RepID=A0A2V1DF01_9PLEO|nr:hypothetical protein DM02DRAFT_731664 [Periconia macrospinosa]
MAFQNSEIRYRFEDPTKWAFVDAVPRSPSFAEALNEVPRGFTLYQPTARILDLQATAYLRANPEHENEVKSLLFWAWANNWNRDGCLRDQPGFDEADRTHLQSLKKTTQDYVGPYYLGSGQSKKGSWLGGYGGTLDTSSSLRKLQEELKDQTKIFENYKEDMTKKVAALHTKSLRADSLEKEIEARNEELKARNEELKARNEELKARNEELKARNEKMAELEKHIGSKEGELESRRSEKESFMRTIAQHQDKAEKANENLERAQTDFTKALATYSKQIKDQHDDLEKVKKALEMKEKNTMNVNTKYFELIKAHDSLQSAHAVTTKKCDYLKAVSEGLHHCWRNVENVMLQHPQLYPDPKQGREVLRNQFWSFIAVYQTAGLQHDIKEALKEDRIPRFVLRSETNSESDPGDMHD